MSSGALPSITVGHLRQNPTAMLRQVQGGQSYVVTSHGLPIAQVSPIEQPRWVPSELVNELLSAPEETGWLEELAGQRAAAELTDPWITQ